MLGGNFDKRIVVIWSIKFHTKAVFSEFETLKQLVRQIKVEVVVDEANIFLLQSQWLRKLIFVDVVESDLVASAQDFWIVKLLSLNLLTLLLNSDAPIPESHIILKLLDELIYLLKACLRGQFVPCQLLLVSLIFCKVLWETSFLTKLNG